MKKFKKVLLIVLCSVVGFTAVCFGGLGIYASDYYHADELAVSACISDNSGALDGVIVKTEKNSTVFIPEVVESGLIFYPGGKVEYTAYAPLMREFAKNGVLCVLVKMPFNLAVMNVNAANGIAKNYPEVTSWAIGGHSLGGAMAASYASKHANEFDNLLLLAAYSTSDVKSLNVISVYGTNDGVMQRDKYKKYQTNLPENFHENVLEGGNHASFGSYGAQKGDGTATITCAEQAYLTVEYFLLNKVS